MTSVITGDIIGSRQQESQHWVEDLKKSLLPLGKTIGMNGKFIVVTNFK